MTTNIIELPLYSDPYFSYNIDLEGVNRTLTFRWNDRANSWHFDITQEEGKSVVAGIRVVANYPMLVDYQLDEYSMTGYFALVDAGSFSSGKLDTKPEAMSQWYKLFYIYTTEN